MYIRFYFYLLSAPVFYSIGCCVTHLYVQNYVQQLSVGKKNIANIHCLKEQPAGIDAQIQDDHFGAFFL